MFLVSQVQSLNQAKKFIDNKVDCILVGYENFALRCTKTLNNSELKDLIQYRNDKKSNTKIFVLMNSFIFENQISDLENKLCELNELKVDKVYFQDYAIVQIIREKQLNLEVAYHSETMVTSYGQFDFFIENKINHLVLARELFMNEIKQMHDNKKSLSLEMQIQGYAFFMHSRWKMISNFEAYARISDKLSSKKQLWIREALRKYPNAIYEDEFGTHMFTGYILCAIKHIKELYEYGLDYVRIDSIMIDEKAHESITLIYQNIINDLRENKTVSEDKINKNYGKIEQLCLPIEIASGFFGGIKEIKHLIKEEKAETKQ
ncbi:U32 family peptidase [Mycoplasma sp. T363T]|uniref:U32 family peptidase n=1 Tax=Mycoplasma bradburyae TaxID=2963128 RepID=UPI002341B534|nr:U32 family peptidase [Mycoplasma bradburyae]MDC4163110.1 U32 family peptidase [Mycoplasma bradburyae]MDC4182426.1 U32 family peptidase [Mycoplasma bradburyae]